MFQFSFLRRLINSWKRGMENLALLGERRNENKFWLGNILGRDHFGGSNEDKRIMLQRILRK